jgi:hypothetical protein
VNGEVLTVCDSVECDAATLFDAVTISKEGDTIDMTNVGSTPQPTNVTIWHTLTITTATPLNLTTELGSKWWHFLYVYGNVTLEGDFTIDVRMSSPPLLLWSPFGVPIALHLITRHIHTHLLARPPLSCRSVLHNQQWLTHATRKLRFHLHYVSNACTCACACA